MVLSLIFKIYFILWNKALFQQSIVNYFLYPQTWFINQIIVNYFDFSLFFYGVAPYFGFFILPSIFLD
jgi:hypothetical protein